MNDIVNHLKALFIKAEIGRKKAEEKFNNSRCNGHWGNAEHYDEAVLYNQLSDDLKERLDRLAPIKQENTFFERETTLNSYCYVDQCRAMGLI